MAWTTPHTGHRLGPDVAGAGPPRQAGERNQGNLQPTLRNSAVTFPDNSGPHSSPRESDSSKPMTTPRIRPERVLEHAGGVSGLIYSSMSVVVLVIMWSVSGLLAAI